MNISVREYQASQKLELRAYELREDIGANQFYSLICAAYRVAGTGEQYLLESIFPGIGADLAYRYNTPVGLRPGEYWQQDNLIITMDDNGKTTVTEL